ncbi:hypothetical protein [Metabacillus fastidiosus]|uniref:Uncharacterized protein n=1 Tax=Metabacillus fastidiosus TaxID=1458 RepID=A0ABU6P235_9BACI|nr:hypothetical protein [Metabacillus fastidiosus]
MVNEKDFSIVVPRGEVSYEEYDFSHEELDGLLISAEHLKKLLNLLVLEILSYVNEQGYEGIAGMVEEEVTRRLLYEV